MYDSIPLTKVTPFRGTSQVTRRKKLHPLIAALQPGASILARRVTLPLLLLTAGMVVVQPCAGQSGTWTPTGSLVEARYYHTATLLPNGKVLVAGGYNDTSLTLASAELYDPVSGTWTATGNLATSRYSHTATLLPNGKVLAAGGYNFGELASAELYDPESGSWTATGNLATARWAHNAILLTTGKVLVAGGYNQVLVAGGFNYNNISIASAELYDPVTGALELQNISTGANVGNLDHVLIGGIIITGNGAKQVVLRAIGPSLSGVGVTNPLADPTLDLFDSAEALVASNDNWMKNSAEDQMILTDNNLAPSGDLESALVVNLDPSAYTAIVRGVGDTTGIALVEAYDLDNGATDSLLGNISTRGFVGTGEDVMIGGFILGAGAGFAQVIVRGIGPSLTDFGVTDALVDPFLELHDSEGTVIASNDNWMDDPNMETVVDRGLAPSDSNESAIYQVLPIGAYTAILSGVGDTTGVGLVEVYNLPNTL